MVTPGEIIDSLGLLLIFKFDKELLFFTLAKTILF
jgi:hypothetical protein